MAPHTTHWRSLAGPHLHTSMDPPQRKHPKSAPAATAEFHPDPTFASHTIQTMSNHFATLYTTHKLLASSNGSNGVPQSKSMDFSGGSTTGLTKSNHQRRRIVKEMEKKRTIATKSAVQTKEIAQNGTKTAFFRDQKTNQSKKDTNFKNDFQRQDSELKKTHQGWEVRRPEAMDGGARKSICSFEAELSDFLKRSGARVMTTDMPPFMQAHAVECARKAYNSLEKFTSKALAFTLKKEFDGVYGPAWHCIVGTGFGSFVTHSVGGFLYFSMDRKMYVLLFKTTVQRADST